MRHGWLRHITDIETNPRTQLVVHVWGQRFWIANVPVLTYLFFWQPRLFLSWGVFVTALYSLYANWSTDNGAASAIKAEMNTNPTNKVIHTSLEELLASRSH